MLSVDLNTNPHMIIITSMRTIMINTIANALSSKVALSAQPSTPELFIISQLCQCSQNRNINWFVTLPNFYQLHIKLLHCLDTKTLTYRIKSPNYRKWSPDWSRISLKVPFYFSYFYVLLLIFLKNVTDLSIWGEQSS